MGNYNKNIIWSNTYEETQYLKEELRESLEEEMTEEELIEYTVDVNDMYLTDVADQFSRIWLPEDVVAIADLGFWNGRTLGYDVIGLRLDNVFSIGNGYLETEWYVDNEEFKAEMRHHDNTNYVTYRMFKENTSLEDKDTFLEKIYNNELTEEDIETYTHSLKDIIKKELSIA